MRQILPPSFYDRDPSRVAPDLLGKFVVRRYKGEVLAGMITETEAYLSQGDEAAHAFSKRSPAKESLYKKGGHAYVHGMRHHSLLDVVVQGENIPGSVLIRAIHPIESIETMKSLRGKTTVEGLTDGPAKVTQALGVNRAQDGIDLTIKNNELYIEDRGVIVDQEAMVVTKRIGITKSVDMPLRFYIG